MPHVYVDVGLELGQAFSDLVVFGIVCKFWCSKHEVIKKNSENIQDRLQDRNSRAVKFYRAVEID